jgi:two-component system, OmpR family, sensor histidine kinase VicK
LFQSEENIFIEGDTSRLIHVLSNLLSNAIEFAKEGEEGIGATITITAEKKHNLEVIVKVKDTGNGINSKILPQLFSNFASKSFKDTALGLFIAKNIVESRGGGKIWAENNNLRIIIILIEKKELPFTLLYQPPIHDLM